MLQSSVIVIILKKTELARIFDELCGQLGAFVLGVALHLIFEASLRRSDFLERLIRELQVVLDIDSLLDLGEESWRREEKAKQKKSPARSELVDVWYFGSVGPKRDGTASRLNAPRHVSISTMGHEGVEMNLLVEARKVGELTTVVGQGSHIPVHGSLPHGIEEAVEDVEKHWTHIA